MYSCPTLGRLFTAVPKKAAVSVARCKMKIFFCMREGVVLRLSTVPRPSKGPLRIQCAY